MTDTYQLSNDEAIERFKQILASKPEWEKLQGGQFIDHLAVFNSWQYRAAMWRLERDRQEAFLSTAVNRSSVLAGAEDKSYVPRMAVPASGLATIKNASNSDIAAAAGTTWLMPDQTPVTIIQTTIIPANGSASVKIEQYENYNNRQTITESKPFYEILIDKELTPKVCKVEVFIDGERWSHAPRLMNIAPNSRVYDLYYTSLDQLGIRFGDGFFGRIPTSGMMAQIKLSLTLGDVEIAAGQKMSRVILAREIPSLANLSAVTATTIKNGKPQEDIESIRLNAKYYPLYDEQLVWRDDYKYQVQRIWPETVWARVWGEQEQEEVYGIDIMHINKIYISAWSPTNPSIGTEIIEKLEEPLNRRYVFVDPNMLPFTITLNAILPRTVQVTDSTAKITNALLLNYGRDSKNRKDEVFIKDLYSIVEKTGVFVDGGSFEIEIAGLAVDNGLNDLIYLDLVASSLVIDYE